MEPISATDRDFLGRRKPFAIPKFLDAVSSQFLRQITIGVRIENPRIPVVSNALSSFARKEGPMIRNRSQEEDAPGTADNEPRGRQDQSRCSNFPLVILIPAYLQDFSTDHQSFDRRVNLFPKFIGSGSQMLETLDETGGQTRLRAGTKDSCAIANKRPQERFIESEWCLRGQTYGVPQPGKHFLRRNPCDAWRRHGYGLLPGPPGLSWISARSLAPRRNAGRWVCQSSIFFKSSSDRVSSLCGMVASVHTISHSRNSLLMPCSLAMAK